MDNKGEMKVQMVAEGTITYPDGTVKEITITTDDFPLKQEKKEDGNNTNSGD